MNAPLVVGNWKMHGIRSECRALASAIARRLRSKQRRVEIVLAPPFTAIETVQKLVAKARLGLAAQNCHWESQGAFTGEISTSMLRDLGCTHVILGHSERRHLLHETDEEIRQKVAAALAQGLGVILCVGESLSQRQSGQTNAVITRQLRVALKGHPKGVIKNVAIAYEPVWAIGTGQNATARQVSQVHGKIRSLLKSHLGSAGGKIRILYGGSVKPENAREIASASDVDGLLVGGASLQAQSFN